MHRIMKSMRNKMSDVSRFSAAQERNLFLVRLGFIVVIASTIIFPTFLQASIDRLWALLRSSTIYNVSMSFNPLYRKMYQRPRNS